MNKKLSRVIIAGIIGVIMMFANQVTWADSVDMVKFFKDILKNAHQLSDSERDLYLKTLDETLTEGEKSDLIVDNKNWYIWLDAHKNIDVILSAAAWRTNHNEKLAALCIEYFNTISSSQEITFFKISNSSSAPAFTMLPSNEILPELTESDFFNPGEKECFSIEGVGYRLPREGTSIQAFILNADEDELLGATCFARLKNIDHIELEWTGQKFIKGAEKPKAEKPKQAAE